MQIDRTCRDVYKNVAPGRHYKGNGIPTTERQLRALGRLPPLKLQRTAWNTTVEAVGQNPIRTRDVEKEVRTRIKLTSPASRKKHAAKPLIFQISAADAAKIRTRLQKPRAAFSKPEDQPTIEHLLDEIENPLPGSRDVITCSPVARAVANHCGALEPKRTGNPYFPYPKEAGAASQ